MCWYCYWGWPKPVMDIFEKHVALLDGDDGALEFSQSHIAWADSNFDDHNIEYCIKECDSPSFDYEQSAEVARIIRESLVELMKIPVSVRCPPGSDLTDDDPLNHPPPAGMVMVKR